MEKKNSSLTLEQLDGITTGLAIKLARVGVNTVEALAFSTVKELELADITPSVAKTLIHNAQQLVMDRSFVTVKELIETRRNIQMLSTGAKAIDELIGGGYETQSITEYYGEYGVGKSQSAYTACVLVQKTPEEGGLDGAALFIDTENTFSPKRVAQIAKARGLDVEKVFDRIILANAFNVDHQMFLVEHADKLIKENGIRLLVVDSLTAHFRSEYLGREMLAERQQKLNKHLHQLLRLARMFNLVVLITNQVVATPEQRYYADNWEAVGGHIMGHTSTLRLKLRKAVANKRIVTVVDSSWLPWGERMFQITEKGIEDVPSE